MKLLFSVCIACFVSQVCAQQATTLSSIRVTGEAVVTVKPDRAQIVVGVLTQDKLSQGAVTQNARQSDAVQNALHKLLGADADIKTANFSLSPDFQYRPNAAKTAISGYTALNTVRVTVDDLDKVGQIIDAAAQAGANHVESVQFTVRDPQAPRSQALREAAAKARADADALAAALNLRIVRIVSVEESREAPPPVSDIVDAEARAAAGVEPAPIQPGALDYPASVTLTVEVAAR